MGRSKNGICPDERYGNSVRITDTCWLWAARINKHGYGEFFYGGKYVRAHRLMWEWAYGPIPVSMHVCHNCPGGDNPACVNPKHLWLGTQKENCQDASQKGVLSAARYRGEAWHKRFSTRSLPRGDKHWTRLQPEKVSRGVMHYRRLFPEKGARGERVNTAKLTPELVRQIRQEYIPWKVSTPFLAKKYGISKAQAHKVVTHQAWKHIG